MDSKTIAAQLEARANSVGVPIYSVCERAGIAPSTFYRWREGGPYTSTKVSAISSMLDTLEQERAA